MAVGLKQFGLAAAIAMAASGAQAQQVDCGTQKVISGVGGGLVAHALGAEPVVAALGAIAGYVAAGRTGECVTGLRGNHGYTGRIRRSSVFVGGGQYVMSPVVETSSTGQAAPASIAGYPLLPGDVDLWNSLNEAQRQRALAFLESGSSIRSSLQAD